MLDRISDFLEPRYDVIEQCTQEMFSAVRLSPEDKERALALSPW